MTDKPIKANDLIVEVFSSVQCGDDAEEFQSAVNSWLKTQPDNIVIEDVIYNHSGRTPRGKDIMSMVILSRHTHG